MKLVRLIDNTFIGIMMTLLKKIVKRRRELLCLFLLVIFVIHCYHSNYTLSVIVEHTISVKKSLMEKVKGYMNGKYNSENRAREHVQAGGDTSEDMEKAMHIESRIPEEVPGNKETQLKLTESKHKSNNVQDDVEGDDDVKESKQVNIEDEMNTKFNETKNSSVIIYQNEKEENIGLKIVNVMTSERTWHDNKNDQSEEEEEEEDEEKEDSQQGQVNLMEEELEKFKTEEELVAQVIDKDKHGNTEDVLQKKGKLNLSNEDQTIDEQKIYNTNEKFSQNILLLSSMGRSGSSFLGGLLSSQMQVFYFFEPFHNIEKRHLLTEQVAINGLRSIFTCNITTQIISLFRSKPKFAIREYFQECGKKRTCLERETINTACQKKAIRFVKTIRTRVSWLAHTLNDAKVNMKLIHLIRDPRGSLVSGWNLGWKTNATSSCEELGDDLRSGLILSKLYPDKYIALRYEDLCDDPWGLANYIFNFLGYKTLPESTVRFLKSYTSNNNQRYAFSIKRNTTSMQQKWRSTITEMQLKQVEQNCTSAITHLGFRLFHNINYARNYSLSLYNDVYVNKLFKYKMLDE